MYFDRLDFKKACEKFDNYGDDTVTQVNFERALLASVESLSTQEATELSAVAPRLNNSYEHLRIGMQESRSRQGSLGRHDAARKELDQETRIFYVRLANELNDLAALEIPINLLYDRHDPPLETPKDSRTAQEKESQQIFAFLDPRLHHLKINFTRESLQLQRVSFVNNR